LKVNVGELELVVVVIVMWIVVIIVTEEIEERLMPEIN
jgi:hypothetical protein